MTQSQVDAARNHLYSEGERLMSERDLQVEDSPEFWRLHDAAWNLFDAAEALLTHKIRRSPLDYA